MYVGSFGDLLRRSLTAYAVELSSRSHPGSIITKRRSNDLCFQNGGALLYAFKKEEGCSTFSERRSSTPCLCKGGLLHGFENEEHCSFTELLRLDIKAD